MSPLDQILRVFGFKVSRDNPMFIEIQFGIGLEIGIITIDTAAVRATFESGGGAPDISISRLRATIDVPGTLHGTREVFVADGSAFRYLPAKGLTFTLMANADRVASAMVECGR